MSENQYSPSWYRREGLMTAASIVSAKLMYFNGMDTDMTKPNKAAVRTCEDLMTLILAEAKREESGRKSDGTGLTSGRRTNENICSS